MGNISCEGRWMTRSGSSGWTAAVHFEPAGVRLDHALGDGEAEADARVARGEKRIRGAGRDLGGETAAIVVHAEGEARPAVRPGFGRDRDRDPGRIAGGLEAVEEDLLQGVQQARPVAAHERVRHVAVDFEVAGLLAEEGARMRRSFSGAAPRAAARRWRPLSVCARKSICSVKRWIRLVSRRQRRLQRVAEFSVGIVGVEELLVGGERDERVADLVGEALGDEADELEVGGLDLGALRGPHLGEVLQQQQRRLRQRAAARREGDQRHAEDLRRRAGVLVDEGRRALAPFNHLAQARAERRRQLGKGEAGGGGRRLRP